MDVRAGLRRVRGHVVRRAAHRDRPDPTEYAYANAAALVLVDAEGADTFWEFYRSFRDADSTAEADRILEHLYGFDAAELDERTLERIRDEVG